MPAGIEPQSFEAHEESLTGYVLIAPILLGFWAIAIWMILHWPLPGWIFAVFMAGLSTAVIYEASVAHAPWSFSVSPAGYALHRRGRNQKYTPWSEVTLIYNYRSPYRGIGIKRNSSRDFHVRPPLGHFRKEVILAIFDNLSEQAQDQGIPVIDMEMWRPQNSLVLGSRGPGVIEAKILWSRISALTLVGLLIVGVVVVYVFTMVLIFDFDAENLVYTSCLGVIAFGMLNLAILVLFGGVREGLLRERIEIDIDGLGYRKGKTQWKCSWRATDRIIYSRTSLKIEGEESQEIRTNWELQKMPWEQVLGALLPYVRKEGIELVQSNLEKSRRIIGEEE